MPSIDYKPHPRDATQHALGQAMGWFFVGCLTTSSAGALTAMIVAPASKLADAAPVMAIIAMPLQSAIVTLFTWVFAVIIRRVCRPSCDVSRPRMAAIMGGVGGLIQAGLLYLPKLAALAIAAILFAAIPMMCAVGLLWATRRV